MKYTTLSDIKFKCSLQQKTIEPQITVKAEVKVEVAIETEEVVIDNQEKLSTETQDKIPIFKDPTFVVSIV